MKPEPTPEPITVTLSMHLLDQADNLRGAAELWQAWADEEGRHCDVNAFIGECIAWAQKGTALILVAWMGQQAVGMGIIHANYDTSTGRTRAVGERLYVLQSCRKRGVFRELQYGAEVFSILIGATEEVISCRWNSTLKEHYEGMGFRPSDVILKRPV